ncbi:MAG: prepilin-type N-terminal cleavage/methylation domain-containing protein [Bryobacteraceae bacterium]
MKPYRDGTIRLNEGWGAPRFTHTTIPGPHDAGVSRSRRGVTLIEMLIVVAIVSLMAGMSYPSVSAGIDSLRLSTAGNAIVGFLNGALSRAERRQIAVVITISKAENSISMRSEEPGFVKNLELPTGVRIVGLIPPSPEDDSAPRHVLLFPGGTVPRFGVEIENQRGGRRIVRVDPVTGVAQVERPANQ